MGWWLVCPWSGCPKERRRLEEVWGISRAAPWLDDRTAVGDFEGCSVVG